MARPVLNGVIMLRTTHLVGGLLLITAASAAHAQPVFQKVGKPEDVKDVSAVEWTAKGEIGLVASTGNARTQTLTAGANAMRKDKDNKLELTLAVTYAKATTRTAIDADGDGAIGASELGETSATSAENGAIKLRYDRYLTPGNALYIAALAAYDRPAGKDFQGGAQVGYSRGLYRSESHEVLGELGYDLSFVDLAAGSSTTVHSARAFAGYKAKLREETALEASLEALMNGNTVTYGAREASIFEATRLNAFVSVTTALSTKLSLSASFTAKYDHFPAPLAAVGGLPFVAGFEPPAEELDTLTKVSLIIKFL